MVGASETAPSLIVQAASTVDPGKSGAAIITVPPPAVSSVTVSPGSATVIRGQTQTFTATVTGTGNPDQTVTWSVLGGGSGTSISGGVLTVGASETASSLIVRAASTVDTGKSGFAEIIVPQVSSVTVNPGSATVSRGQTKTFTAAVTGTGNPAQTVTWSVSGGGSGTSITSGGVLTVGAGETATSLTVRATSTYDTGKFGTAAVTVPPRGAGGVTLIYPEDEDLGAFTNDSIILSKSGAGGKPTTQTFTVAGTYASYQWRVDGTVKGSSGSITLTAAGYTIGSHQISVVVTHGGVPYSKTGSFRVEN
jgi:uncharacterized protein YjdB